MKVPWKVASLIFIVLLNSAVFQSQTVIGLQQPPVQTHGQTSGDVTDSTAIIWTRVSRAALVSVEAALDPAFLSSWMTAPVLVGAGTDFTAKIELTQLEPHQLYYYRVHLQDASIPSLATTGPMGAFITAPAPDHDASFSFAVTGDSWSQFKPYRIFSSIQDMQPDFFIYLGDTVYADLMLPPARTIDQYRRSYKINREDDPLRTFLGMTSTYVIWDDHEVQNNFDSTHPRIPIGRQAFLEYWPIRVDAQDPARLYRSFRWGRVAEFFIVDTRQYRSPSSRPDNASKTMLGTEQKAWLKAALLASTAAFKFIVTSVPLRFHSSDTWEGYTTERQELFDFIAQNNITGIIVLSADVHYAAVINHPEGFKEIITGPIGQIPSGSQPARGRPETEFTSNRELNYGFVRVHGDQAPALVEITILDENNRVLHTTMVQGQ